MTLHNAVKQETRAWLLVLSLLSFFTVCRAADTPPRLSTTITFMPLAARWGVPLIPVRVNNRIAGTFALDTGTNFTAISDKLVAQLGLTPKPFLKDGKPYLIDGAPSNYVDLSAIQVGTLRLSGLVLVLDSRRLANTLGRPVDGVLGANLLSVMALLIDFPQHKATLWYPGGLASQDVQQAQLPTAPVLTMTTSDGDFDYSVPVLFRNGTRSAQESLLIDTGAGLTAVSRSVAQELGLVPVRQDVKTTRFGGTFTTCVAPVTSLALGRISMTDQNVGYLSPKASGQYPPVLGVDVLGGYRVLLDFPARKMYLAPPLSVAPPVRIKTDAARAVKSP